MQPDARAAVAEPIPVTPPARASDAATFAHVSQRARIWRRLRRHKLAMAGLVFLGLLIVCALGADVISPYPPLQQQMSERLRPPSASHWLGTDDFGRDILTRIMYGSRISLQVGFVAVGLAGSIGIILGLLAGYFGGAIDGFLMRCMDVILAFPAILLAVTIMALLGPSTTNVMIAIGIAYIPVFARVVRGAVLTIKPNEYVDAARAAGASESRMLFQHVLPGTSGPIIVQVSLALAYAILAEAALSFLGLGTQPPTPTWGSMLSFGREFVRDAPWFTFFPGFAIFLTVLSLNLVGDGLSDALDPRL
ncbi:MAG TPA: ABC transporter permease [Chloroflexota bacterium]|jgi:peptide/nickel transport system permease protein